MHTRQCAWQLLKKVLINIYFIDNLNKKQVNDLIFKHIFKYVEMIQNIFIEQCSNDRR